MLHTEEFEIIVPDIPSDKDEQPVLLTIGPMSTMLIPVAVMALFGSRIYNGNTHSFMYFGMITALSSALSGMLWGFLSHRYRKKYGIRKESERKKEYERYLGEVNEHLEECTNENKKYMFERYPSSADTVNDGIFSERYLYAPDRDFIRLGIGRSPFQMQLKISNNRKEMFESEESIKARDIVERYGMLNDVPVGMDLKCGQITGVIGKADEEANYGFFLDLLVKISAQYQKSNVKTVLFFDENKKPQQRLYETVKLMPHFFMEGTRIRAIAGNPQDSLDVLPYLGEQLISKDVRFIVFILDMSLIKGETLEEALFLEKDKSNLSIVLFCESEESLPSKCSNIIILPEKGIRSIKIKKREEESFLRAIPDVPPEMGKCREYFSDLFAKNFEEGFVSEEIPQKVSFTKLYDVKRLEDIDVALMWNKNFPEERLKVPIGIGNRNEKVYLDVHERFHGPHGLIAGTTGSGKSELIQSYLISLCLSYSPTEVNFFLIDYKGGGTGDSLRELPHCAGVISNLSGSMIKRALSAIRSENEQRQILFSKYKVNHIDEYNRQRRKNNDREPLPHLFLIIDEFAQMRKEEPEFMQEIISLSAVGRSLGIHLILATQKPSGVVDEKIWSNSRFKLCLKVQDKQDSMDMLKKPDAAYLKRSGQCYLQIGLDEYFRCFQTGYLGDIYDPGEDKNNVYIVGRSGKRIGADEGKKEGPTYLESLKDLIISSAVVEGYEKAPSLWIDELPKTIYEGSDTVREVMDEEPENGVLFGIYDDPSRQRRGALLYDPYKYGHLAIAGGPASGKSTLLKLLAKGLHNIESILIDMAGSWADDEDLLSGFKGYLSSKEGCDVFFYHLKRCFVKRDTPLFVFIDDIAYLLKNISDEQTELLMRMISDGIGCNIFFIISGGQTSDFPSKIFSKIKTTLSLEMNDRFGYGDMLRFYRLPFVPEKGKPGRGLCVIDNEVFEFQALLPDAEKPVIKQKKPDSFPVIPQKPSPGSLLRDFVPSKVKRILPLGYSRRSGFVRGIDITDPTSFFILGPKPGVNRFVLEMLKSFVENLYPGMVDDCVFAKDISELPDACRMKDKYVFFIYENNNPVSDPERAKALKQIIQRRQGIYVGSNASQQTVLNLSDLSFKELGSVSNDMTGFMRLEGRQRTLVLQLPFENREDDEDDYD
ncbi:MAG: AAA family ATPase [Lachnospiraceae bacterium]|nr:AAA family ATPase [Lachnospiraceae bacterium]